jgi:prevent-host-death family protein
VTATTSDTPQRSIPASAAKSRLAEWLRAVEAGERILITRHGRAVAALVPPEELEQLQRLRSAGPEGGLAGLIGGWEGAEELVAALATTRRGRARKLPPQS